MSPGARLDHKCEIPNHYLILLFLKQQLHLPIYNQSHQPVNIEGDRAGCLLCCWPLLMQSVLAQTQLDNSPIQNLLIHFILPTYG